MHDFDTLMGLCDVPFTHGRGQVESGKSALKEELEAGYGAKPEFDGRMHTVKAIQPYKEAKARFSKDEARAAAAVIDDDLVVRVEVVEKRGSSQARLLLRMKEGKLRLVGIQPESDD